jgi:hypothetical protein
MSLYDKASLVQIPSGTKDGTLYSVLPANGNGDFTHTRASSATRVNKDGLIESVASGVPRLDYPLVNGVAQDCPALLLEPSRTNNVPYSVFDADVPTGWAVGFGTGTFTHELTTFKGQPAIKHTQLTTGRSYLQDSASLAASTTYTFSMYVDLENSGDIASNEVIAAISMTGDSGDDEVTFGEIDQDTGLCQFTFTTTVSASCNIRLGFGAFSNTSQLNKPLIFSMPQLEAGSYATSYIPTSGSAVTRSADECNGAGTTTEFNDSEGVLFVEFAALANDLTHRRIAISDGTTGNLVYVSFDTASNRILANANGRIMVYTVSDETEFQKAAVYYNATAPKLYVNGVLRETETAMTAISGLNELAFDGGTGGNDFYGKVKQVMVFNEALTDAELATLTS